MVLEVFHASVIEGTGQAEMRVYLFALDTVL